jgi:benzoyl-CoA reductase/2-hydroxyglutaryl-CoA dehydratase subunit BcrC/BadD/HgdB
LSGKYFSHAAKQQDNEQTARVKGFSVMQGFAPDLHTRVRELIQMRKKGKKIIGYIPNGYIPEELLSACDAVPVGLFRGGESAPVTASLAYLGRFLDPFCRAQIGYRTLKQEALYQSIDLLVVPVTDNHMRAIADSWDFYSEVEVLRVGVPHAKTKHALRYYREGLHVAKERLEKLTGTKITGQRLREEIDLSNEMRHLLREISLMRKSDPSRIGGRDFMELNHACLYGDKKIMLERLKSFYKEQQEREVLPAMGPRVLLTGSTLALGDDKVVELLEGRGASIVIEEFCEGMKNYWEDVETNGDLIQALADCYFMRNVPGAFFRGAATERFDFLLNLIKDFKVHAVVWYSLMYRDSYDTEGYLLSRMMERLNLPILRISSDYDDSEKAALETRIETFIEAIEGSREYVR